MNNWKSDLSRSRSDFLNLVWPEIRKWFAGKNVRLIQVEEVQNSYAELLDKQCGIDYLIQNELGLRPVSARVQTDCQYETVTIREKRSTGTMTELEKLKTKMGAGYLHPWLHVQGYIACPWIPDSSTGWNLGPRQLMLAFGVLVRDLLPYLTSDFEDKGDEEKVWYRQVNRHDLNTFLVVRVAALEARGIRVIKYKPETNLLEKGVNNRE